MKYKAENEAHLSYPVAYSVCELYAAVQQMGPTFDFDRLSGSSVMYKNAMTTSTWCIFPTSSFNRGISLNCSLIGEFAVVLYGIETDFEIEPDIDEDLPVLYHAYDCLGGLIRHHLLNSLHSRILGETRR
jgi:hypothetical protein